MSTKNIPPVEKEAVRRALPSSKYCECDLGECRTDFLPLLYEISRIANETGDLGDILDILLNLMRKHLNIDHGAVTLNQGPGGKPLLHRCYEPERGDHSDWPPAAFAAPIIAEVLVSRKPSVSLHGVANNEKMPRENAFICIPIIHGQHVLGTICAERTYTNNALLKLDVEILAILAATTAQAVEIYLLGNVQKNALEAENRRLRSALEARTKPGNIIGNSKAMQEVYRLIDKVSRSRTTILILGESGVGKELVASAIHYGSDQGQGPFIKFNCAALPESVIESELFGHERGSFTGAANMRRGRFEEADGGTIFLDEVGELSLPMQAKLLRVLQEKSFERVGGNTTIQVDIRILAATNRNLQDMVAKGRFREDLYYRLLVFPITIPPLRDRGNDIIALAEHFVAAFSAEMGIDVHRISTPAINMFMTYHWPGNVRELEHIIERAVILAEGGIIEPHHLPPSLQAPAVSEIVDKGALDARLAKAEYEMIVDALTLHRGNMTDAAQHLGLTRRILGLRMGEYQLNYREFRK